jgi:hypothetical protein
MELFLNVQLVFSYIYFRLYQNNEHSKWFLFCEENAFVNYKNLLLFLESKNSNEVSMSYKLSNL